MLFNYEIIKNDTNPAQPGNEVEKGGIEPPIQTISSWCSLLSYRIPLKVSQGDSPPLASKQTKPTYFPI